MYAAGDALLAAVTELLAEIDRLAGELAAGRICDVCERPATRHVCRAHCRR